MVKFAIVIPARGGSKRIDRKNIHPLAGKPLLTWTLEAIVDAGFKDRAYVSTEDTEIKEVAESFGITVIDRPEEFAQDHSSTESVLMHVLDSIGGSPEWVMTLPPTNPFRSPEMLQTFVTEAENAEGYDCLMSVTETTGDYWRIKEGLPRGSEATLRGGDIVRLFPEAPRSQMGRKEEGFTLYEENSAVYMSRISALQAKCKQGAVAPILGDKVKGVVVDPFEAFDINKQFDFEIAEAILASRNKTS